MNFYSLMLPVPVHVPYRRPLNARHNQFIMWHLVKTALLVIMTLFVMPIFKSSSSSSTNVIHASPIAATTINLSPVAPSLVVPTISSQQPQVVYRKLQPIQLAPQPQLSAPSQPSLVCQLPPSTGGPMQQLASQCRRNQDQSFKKTAVAEAQLALQFTSEETRSLLQAYMDEFRDYFVDLVYVSKNKSLALFQSHDSGLVPALQTQGGELTRHLFESITGYLMSAKSTSHHHHQPPHHHQQQQQQHNHTLRSSSSSDINHQINHYFRQMHLLTIQYHQQPHLESQHNSLCVNESLRAANLDWLLHGQEEHLGGESLNERLPVAIRQSLESSHTLLSALALSTEIFHNLTQQASSWMPHDSCHSALTRMLVCPNCYNHHQQRQQQQQQQQPQLQLQLQQRPPVSPAIAAPPCENFCLNVLRGCMNDVYELDKFWTDHVMGIQRLKMNMIQANSIENVFSTLDEKILQMIKTTSSPLVGRRIVERARAKCGETRTRRAAQPGLVSLLLATPPPVVSGPVQPLAAQLAPLPRGQLAALAQTSPLFSLFNRLDTFVHELALTRGFFASWPERICEHMGAVPPPTPAGSDGPDQIDGQQQQQTQLNISASSVCWNGRDYTGYKSNLVQFGQIGNGNPEVQRPNEPFNALILHIIAKLKEVVAQLSRKSTRSPSASIYSEGKFLGPQSPHHRNGLAQIDYGYQAGKQPGANHHQAASHKAPQVSITDHTNRDEDQDRAHHEPLTIDQQQQSQSSGDGETTPDQHQTGDEAGGPANARSGQEEEAEEEEEVGDDVEGSGDYYTDDYPDDEQEDVVFEGDEQSQQGGAGQPASPDQEVSPTGIPKPTWDSNGQLSTMDANNNNQNQNANQYGDQQWTDSNQYIDRAQYNQAGFIVAQPPRYIEANNRVGSSASPNSPPSPTIMVALTVAASIFSALSLLSHMERPTRRCWYT